MKYRLDSPAGKAASGQVIASEHDAGSREMRKKTQSMPTEVGREACTGSLGFKLNLASSKQVDSD